MNRIRLSFLLVAGLSWQATGIVCAQESAAGFARVSSSGIAPAADRENPGRARVTTGQVTPSSFAEFAPVADPMISGSPNVASMQCSPYAARVGYDPCVPSVVEPLHWELAEFLAAAVNAPVEPLASVWAKILCAEHDQIDTALHEDGIGLQPIPPRPKLFVETNEKFLAPGFLEQGITLPTGAVWRPSFWVFGTYRSGVNYIDPAGGAPVAEWANRLDLFGQVNLSGTERVLVGLRPFDEETANSRRFASYDFRNGDTIDGANAEFQTLFFEGDFGEIFPNLDPYDSLPLDYGFSVGRQPMLFQQGLLINEDRIDAVTVTKNTLSGGGILNLRATGAYAWNNINRNNNVDDPNAQLVGLLTETDIAGSTINADIAYVDSPNARFGSLLAYGVSAIQRIGSFHNTYNSSVHFLGSHPTDGETQASGQGQLLFSQMSWTPHHTHDLVYANGFWAIDQFTSPARGTLGGGPLGQTGVLFSAAGLGRYGAPLSNQASNVAGGSIGYQLFFDGTRKQIIFEVGGRKDTNEINAGAIAGGVRYQQAIGQHWIFLIDGFVAEHETLGTTPGTRIEMLAKF